MHLHLQKRYFWRRCSFLPHPSIHTKYFTVSSGQEVDLAPVIAMNFTCYKIFLYFSDLSWGGPDLPRSTTGNASVDRSNLGYKQSQELECLAIE